MERPIYNSNPQTSGECLRLACHYISSHNKSYNEEIVRLLDIIIKRHEPEYYYKAYNELGRFYLHSEKIDIAIQCFEIVYLSDDTHDKCIAAIELSKAYIIKRNHSKVINYLSYVMTNGSLKDQTLALFQYARLAKKENNNQEALKYLNKLIFLNAQNYFALAEIADIYFNEHQYHIAKKYYHDLLNGNSGDQNIAHVRLAKIALLDKDYDTCKEHLDQVIIYNKKDMEIINNEYANLFYVMHAYEEAKKCLLKNIHSYSPYATSLANEKLGILYALEGDIKNATSYLEKVKYKNVHHQMPLLLLGCIYFNQKKYLLARACYKEIKNNTTSIYYLFDLLTVDMAEGKYEDAFLKASFLYNHRQDFADYNKLNNIIFFLSYQLNCFIPEFDYTNISNRAEAMFDYNETKIYEHFNAFEKDKFKEPNFNQYLSYIQKMLPNLEKGSTFEFDSYIVPYLNAGQKDENYIKVYTIPGTYNVVDFFPVQEANSDSYLLRSFTLNSKNISHIFEE